MTPRGINSCGGGNELSRPSYLNMRGDQKQIFIKDEEETDSENHQKKNIIKPGFKIKIPSSTTAANKNYTKTQGAGTNPFGNSTSANQNSPIN